jgi:hypothetical protein
MTRLHRRVVAVILGNLGGCVVRIRKSFRVAVGAWGLALAVSISPLSSYLLPTAIVATAITLLWIAHLLAFASRARYPSAEKPTQRITEPSPASAQAIESRRSVMPLFAKALIFGAFVSTAPRSAMAQAMGGCGRDGCSNCARPFYERGTPGRKAGCTICHSCPGDDGQYRCGSVFNC